MALRLFPRTKSSFVHLGGVAVTELPLSGLVRVQPGKRTIHKMEGNPLIVKPVV
jgi:hypothetical protein